MTTEKFRPLLAVACEDITKLNYPVNCSVKIDGLRSIVKDSIVYSRSMKPIPSEAVQRKFGKPEYEGFDGELVYGNIFANDVFTKSTSFCMSKEVPDGMYEEWISFHVFDKISDKPFSERLKELQGTYNDSFDGVELLDQPLLHTVEMVKEFQEAVLAQGAEGVMIRSPSGKYKQGRSTLKEGILLKLKIFTDEEATVVGFEEKMRNTNEAKVDELGYTERSTSKEGMVPSDTLGALVVESEKWGRFNIGTGFDDKMRKEIWDNKEVWLGKLVKFKYFEVGVVEKPRFPVFIGKRSELDI